MVNNNRIEKIKTVVLGLLPGSSVLLFGSRARGDDHVNSDYDILVITPQEFSIKENTKWTTSLHKAIVSAINAPIDILLFSQKEVSENRQLPGHIVRSALREGIVL